MGGDSGLSPAQAPLAILDPRLTHRGQQVLGNNPGNATCGKHGIGLGIIKWELTGALDAQSSVS